MLSDLHPGKYSAMDLRSEKEKSLSGELYNAGDPQLVAARLYARRLLRLFNNTEADQLQLRREFLTELIPSQGKNLVIEPPLYCDYGSNITLGNDVYLNFGCVLLDVARVFIGDNVLIGPSVQIYTATHPTDWQTRAKGLEYAKPVSIGAHAWIGGGAILCPGVSIGERSVIGAGSVVTKDIPSDVVAAGNPCRIIKRLK